MRKIICDFSIISGVIALVLFAHLANLKTPARSAPLGRLLAQGAGMAYGLQVDEQVGQMESQARSVLESLGTSQMSYASAKTSGRYGYLHDLVLAGYLQPNATGVSLSPGYSITFYLPPTKRGFTLIAHPRNIDLRPLLIDENMRVTVLTPTLEEDPDPTWAWARESLKNSYINYGFYDFPNPLEMWKHEPPLQVRLNWEHSDYVLLSLTEKGEKWVADDSLLYVDAFNSYMLGDVRPAR